MRVVEFGSLFQFIRNGMSVKQDKSGDGLPITRIETIADATIDKNRVGYAGVNEEEGRRWLLEPGDILFSHINSVEHVGKCAIYRGIPEKLVHGMNLLCMRCDQSQLLPEFATYLIRSPGFRARLQNFINKAVNQASVSIGNLKPIPVGIPPLPEQRRIAAILDQADALRAKRREALAQLDSLTQAIFIETFGDLSTNSKNWDAVRLSEEVSLQGGFAFKSSDYVASGIPLIRIGDVNRGSEANENPCFLAKNLAGTYSRFLIHPGSLLMSLTGTTGKDDYGNVVVLSNQFSEYFLNQRVACIKPIGTRISKAYLYSFLKDEKVKNLIVSKSRGVRQANISNGDILELALPVPPLELQLKYSESVDRLESLKIQHKKSISELNTLFASLQHRAFRGEL